MRNIGEKVWVSKAAREPVRKLCPDCTVLRTTINRIEIRDGKPQYGTEDGCGFSDEQVHDTEEAAQAEGRERAKAWCAAENAAMKEQARKKGRPRRKSDGSREANPMELYGSLTRKTSKGDNE